MMRYNPRVPMLLIAATTLLSLPLRALAQTAPKNSCVLEEVKPRTTGLEYRDRTYACEGIYIERQSAPLRIQVVSAIKGQLAFDGDDGELLVLLPDSIRTGVFDPEVLVLGRSREENVPWAFDRKVSIGETIRWDLNQVVHKDTLKSQQLGLHGRAQAADGLGEPIIVPVAAVRSGESHDEDAPIEMVVYIPKAARLCWAEAAPDGTLGPLDPTKDCKTATRVSGSDGYFVFMVPVSAKETDGVRILALRWTVRNTYGYGDPALLRVYKW